MTTKYGHKLEIPVDRTATAAITRIAIIGAGLTGLITATLLERQFAKLGLPLMIDIFEKSAGVGRLATRYKSPSLNSDNRYQFDFGVQSFTAISNEFQDFIDPWSKLGVLTPWEARVARVTADCASIDLTDIATCDHHGDKRPRYIGSPKMTSWGRALGQALTHTSIHYKTYVAPLVDPVAKPKPVTRLINSEGQRLGEFDWVITTTPSDQAGALMAESSFLHNQTLVQVNMLGCYSLMLGWRGVEALPDALVNANWDILSVDCAGSSAAVSVAKIFIEHLKPQRDSVLPGVTVHSSHQWAQRHIDENIDKVRAQLLADTQRLLGWNQSCAPAHIDCHRWRFADTRNPLLLQGDVLLDRDKQWLVTGDWAGEGRVESCYEQAAACAANICYHESLRVL